MWLIQAVLAVIVVARANSLPPTLPRSIIDLSLANLHPDTLLNFTELSTKYAKPAETHHITTEDGYNLLLCNIPGDKTRPLLLIHGILEDASTYIIRGHNSLAVTLVNEGYDVWIISVRGTRYSRSHQTLNPDKDDQFWQFTLHELAIYDVAATIDYILESTGQKQVSIVGFSLGTTLTFILGATLPSYNDKIKVFVALAPIVFLQNTRSTFSKILFFSPLIDWLIPPNVYEIGGFYSLSRPVVNVICGQMPFGYDLCYNFIIKPVSGPDFKSVDRDFFSVILGNYPVGTGRMVLQHYAQTSLVESFRQYDYGTEENQKRYNSTTPIEYDLSKVTMPCVLVSGITDPISSLVDVKKLRGILPNVVDHKIIDEVPYNHVDHLWSEDAHVLEYPYILDKLAQYY